MHKRWKYQWFFITAHRELPTIFYGNHFSSNQNVPPRTKICIHSVESDLLALKKSGLGSETGKKPRLTQAHLALLLWICTKSRVFSDSHSPFTGQESSTFAAANTTIVWKWATVRTVPPLARPPCLLCKTWQRASRLKKRKEKVFDSCLYFYILLARFHIGEVDFICIQMNLTLALEMTDKYFPWSVLFAGVDVPG